MGVRDARVSVKFEIQRHPALISSLTPASKRHRDRSPLERQFVTEIPAEIHVYFVTSCAWTCAWSSFTHCLYRGTPLLRCRRRGGSGLIRGGVRGRAPLPIRHSHAAALERRQLDLALESADAAHQAALRLCRTVWMARRAFQGDWVWGQTPQILNWHARALFWGTNSRLLERLLSLSF